MIYRKPNAPLPCHGDGYDRRAVGKAIPHMASTTAVHFPTFPD